MKDNALGAPRTLAVPTVSERLVESVQAVLFGINQCALSAARGRWSVGSSLSS